MYPTYTMFPNTLTIMSGFFQKLWPGAGLPASNNAGIEMLCITAQKAEENARKILDRFVPTDIIAFDHC